MLEHELDHRIPIFEWARPSYRDVPIDTSDPRHDEPLVPLDAFGVACRSYHARTDGANPPYHRAVEGSRVDTWLRRSAAARLEAVNAALRPFGCELLVLDGYRPIACQRGLWRFYCEQARQVLDDPSPDECCAYARGFVADPRDFRVDDSRTWPSHTTGAAADVTLRRLGSEGGEELDMGSNFDEITPTSRNDHFERRLEAGEIAAADPRLWHRRLMHWAMSSHGWVNDPFVFWHYDWGNQLGALVRQALHGEASATAWYGYVADPPREPTRTTPTRTTPTRTA